MNLGQHREELKRLEEAGVIEIVKSRNGTDIKFTDDGEKAMKFMIGLDTDMQLFLFQLLMNHFYSDIEDPHERLLKVAKDLTEIAEINIFRTLEANIDDLNGIELTQGHLPEELVRQFDPEAE